jgi:hypothetical protein
MVGRRFSSGLAGTVLVVALAAPNAIASAQAVPLPAPSPPSRALENAAILKPLSEIGRVRSRTPYCGALARARAGIDAAIMFEYSTPILAKDLRSFRLDSYLNRAKSLRKTENDLSALYDLAIAGRDEVHALRAAANADGVGEARRKEMLDFANALDGAKGRQIMLAKAMARIVGTLAETPIRDITNQPYDDHGASAFTRTADPLHPSDGNVMANVSNVTTATGDAVTDTQQLQQLFSAFTAEHFIREDLKNAAMHGNKAMELGGCNGI